MRLSIFVLALVAVPLLAQQQRPRPAPDHAAGPVPGTMTDVIAHPAPPVKEPGDAFYFDPQNTRVVLVSRGRTFSQVMHNGAIARIETKYSQAGDIIHYEWTLRNAPEARQGIEYVSVDTPAAFANINMDIGLPLEPVPAGWKASAGPKFNGSGSQFFAMKMPSGPVWPAQYDADIPTLITSLHRTNPLARSQSSRATCRACSARQLEGLSRTRPQESFLTKRL